jgi:hypothetical protein
MNVEESLIHAACALSNLQRVTATHIASVPVVRTISLYDEFARRETTRSTVFVGIRIGINEANI